MAYRHIPTRPYHEMHVVSDPVDYTPQFRSSAYAAPASERLLDRDTYHSQYYGATPNTSASTYGTHPNAPAATPQTYQHAERFQAQTSLAAEQERYIRLLEKDLEGVRAELRHAATTRDIMQDLERQLQIMEDQLGREMARSAQLEQEVVQARAQGLEHSNAKLAEAQSQITGMRNEIREREQALRSTEQQLRGKEQEIRVKEQEIRAKDHELNQLPSLRDENRRLQTRVSEVERESMKTKEQLTSTSQQQISELQAELSLNKQELKSFQQELRLKDQHIDNVEAQLKHEKEQTVSSIASLGASIEAFKSEKLEFQKQIQTLTAEATNMKAQLARKDELIALLEEEQKRKQERLTQGDKLSEQLQATLYEKTSSNASLKADIDDKARRIKDLDEHLKRTDSLRKEMEGRETEVLKAYGAISDLVNASELQRQSLSVHNKIRDVLNENATLSKSLTDLRKAHELLQYEETSLITKRKQLECDVALAHETIKKKDGEISAMREQSLERTKELRALVATKDTLGNDVQAITDRAIKLEELLQQKEKVLQEYSRREGRYEEELRHVRSKMESEHMRVINELEAQINAITLEGQSDKQCADACRRLGHMFNVETNTTPLQFTTSLFREIEQLQHGHKTLAEELKTLRKPEAIQSSKSAPLSRLGEEESSAWLKGELRRSEERMSRVVVQFDTFKRDIARALHMDVHDKIDEAVLLSKIHRPATTSDAARGYMGAETLRHRNEPRAADIYVKAPLNNDVEKQSLLRKLQTAMKTITSQDMWIDILNKKLKKLDLAHQSELHREVASLQEQVTLYKRHLATDDKTAPNPVDAEMTSFKDTIAKLELKIQRHVEFRDKLIHALGIRAVSVPDNDIIDHVTSLVRQRPSSTLDSMTLSSSFMPRPYVSYANMQLSYCFNAIKS